MSDNLSYHDTCIFDYLMARLLTSDEMSLNILMMDQLQTIELPASSTQIHYFQVASASATSKRQVGQNKSDKKVDICYNNPGYQEQASSPASQAWV